MSFLATLEYRRIFGLVATYLDERVPNFGWNQDRSRFATLAIDCYLSTGISFLQVSPFEAGNFGDSEAATVERQQDGSIPWIVFSSQYSQDLGLREYSLGIRLCWSELLMHDQHRTAENQA